MFHRNVDDPPSSQLSPSAKDLAAEHTTEAVRDEGAVPQDRLQHVPLDGLSAILKAKKPYVLGLGTIGSAEHVGAKSTVRLAQRCQAKFQRSTWLIEWAKRSGGQPPSGSNTDGEWLSVPESIGHGLDRSTWRVPRLAEHREAGKKRWMAAVAMLLRFKSRYDLILIELGNVESSDSHTLGKLCDGVTLWMIDDVGMRRMAKIVRDLRRECLPLVGCWSTSHELSHSA